jgi:hypothetical protein
MTQPINQTIETLHTKAATLLQQKREEAAIIDELVKEGIEPSYAALIIENVKSDLEDRRLFKKEFGMGVFFVIAGLLINLLSYQLAVNLNSFFFYVFWGIIVLGIIMIYRAFVLFRK